MLKKSLFLILVFILIFNVCIFSKESLTLKTDNINHFIGMVTDSRSFLSFLRHDYFRRVLANFIGRKVEEGLIPNDMDKLIKLVQDISYNNSKNFLNLNG